MESDELDDPTTTYPVAGDEGIESVRWEARNGGVGRVWINAAQYFGEMTKRSWNFFLGGYQPAPKWLKDCKGRRISLSDAVFYARILLALDLTAALMAEIDGVPAPSARRCMSTGS